MSGTLALCSVTVEMWLPSGLRARRDEITRPLVRCSWCFRGVRVMFAEGQRSPAERAAHKLISGVRGGGLQKSLRNMQRSGLGSNAWITGTQFFHFVPANDHFLASTCAKFTRQRPSSLDDGNR